MTADLAPVHAAIAELPALAGCWTIEPLRGLTNRSYLLARSDASVVLRLPGTGSHDLVDRSHEAHNHSIAASLGLAPPLLHSEPSGLLVTRYLQGAAPLDRQAAREPTMIAAVGRLLTRLHRSGARFRGQRDPFENLDRYLALAGERADPELARLRKAAEPAHVALAAAAESRVPSHIDPAPANILVDGNDLRLIDWEYSAMAEPSWDLADFVAEAALDPDGAARLLEACGRDASEREQARLGLWHLALDLLAAAWAQLQIARSGSRDLAGLLAERKARAAAMIGGDLGRWLGQFPG